MSKHYTYTTPFKREKTQESDFTIASDTKLVSTTGTNCVHTEHQEQQTINAPHLKVACFSMVIKRLRQSFMKILFFSQKYAQGRKRIVFGIYRVFRTGQHDLKFAAMQKFKKLVISQKTEELKYTQNVFSRMVQTSGRLFINFFRNKHRRILEQSFLKIQTQAALSKAQRKKKLLRLHKLIVGGRKQRLKTGIQRMKACRYIESRKIKAKQISNIMNDRRTRNLKAGFYKLKMNMLAFRQVRLKNDVGQIDRRIHTQGEEEVEVYRIKMDQLQMKKAQLDKQKEQMNNQFKKQLGSIQEQSDNLQNQVNRITAENQHIRDLIQKSLDQTNEPFTMDEISQLLYHNMLAYLHQNPDVPLQRKDILVSLESPLLPVNVDLKTIQEENQVMKELLSEYIVIFGVKKLEDKGREIEKPYEYLQKENILLHRIMMALVGRLNMTKDDIGNIRDGILGLGDAVKELDKFSNNLSDKKKLIL